MRLHKESAHRLFTHAARTHRICAREWSAFSALPASYSRYLAELAVRGYTATSINTPRTRGEGFQPFSRWSKIARELA
jgi:hypothetical protein